MTQQEWKERISNLSVSNMIELNNQCIIEARDVGEEDLAKDLHWLSKMDELNDEFEDTPPIVFADMICRGRFDASDEYYYTCNGCLYSVLGNSIDDLGIDVSVLIKVLSNPKIESNILSILRDIFGEKW